MVGLDRQRVRLEPYRPEWRDCYRAESARLSGIVGDDVLQFEHVGSTAVEGMPAKPVIDILALVDSADTAMSTVEPLEGAGYELRSNDADRLFFANGPEDNRTHYLHVAAEGGEYATEMLAFRNYLREHPDVAAAYTDLKRALAEQFPADRDSYTEQKSEFVERTVAEALSNQDQ